MLLLLMYQDVLYLSKGRWRRPVLERRRQVEIRELLLHRPLEERIRNNAIQGWAMIYQHVQVAGRRECCRRVSPIIRANDIGFLCNPAASRALRFPNMKMGLRALVLTNTPYSVLKKSWRPKKHEITT